MSEADTDEDILAGEDEDSEGSDVPKKKLSGKVMVLYIVLPLVLILAGGGAAVYYFLLSGGEAAGEQLAEDQKSGQSIVFYELPEMLVNLNTGGGKRKTYLKVRISLELQSADDVQELDLIMPRIVDSFQVYLRELRVEDLQGSTGLMRLKEELLTRLNVTARPIKINDVLFREMLVQ